MTYPIPDVYQMTFIFQQEFGFWMILMAILLGFILSFAVGANDSANSWGTVIGAQTVSLGVAFVLGSIAETAGALLLSSGVISTIAGSHSVVKMSLYIGDNITVHNGTEWDNFKNNTDFLMGERQLMLGFLSSMIASQLWQLIATYLTWPVSGTHSIISALIGFTMVEKGFDGVNIGEWVPWCGSGIFKVLYGLLVSPLFALVIAFVFYFLIYREAIIGGKPRSRKNRIWYTACVFLMFTSIGFTTTTAKQFDEQIPRIIPKEGCRNWNTPFFGILVGTVFGIVFAVPFHFFIIPYLLDSKREFRISFDFLTNYLKKRKEGVNLESYAPGVLVETTTFSKSGSQAAFIDEVDPKMDVDETDEIKNVFRPLQVISAFFAALNHGGNDVGNCIGPLVTIYAMYKTPIGYSTDDPAYIWKLWGGIGIALGLVVFGERVIMTMGTKICAMTPSLGFVVVTSASVVVMLCSLFGIPTSTTQCQVMALVGAGIARGWVETGSLHDGLKTVDLGVFKNIGLSWIVTIPFSIALSAIFYAVLRVIVIGPF